MDGKSHKIMYTNEKETAIEGNCNICTEKSNRKRTAVSFMLYVQIICCANNFFFIVLASRSLFASCSRFRADLSLQSGEEYLREMQKATTDFFAFDKIKLMHLTAVEALVEFEQSTWNWNMKLINMKHWKVPIGNPKLKFTTVKVPKRKWKKFVEQQDKFAAKNSEIRIVFAFSSFFISERGLVCSRLHLTEWFVII